MRRGVGIGAINKKQAEQQKFAATANQIAENQVEKLTQQMEVFKKNLEEFAFKYKNEIKNSPQFRKQFQDMCANIGVDPLASSKGFWSELLGVGDFYYEIAVQIVEMCNMYQEKTGGLLYLDFILEKLKKQRSRFTQEISLDDCMRAIKKLHAFGNGFTLISMKNDRYIVQSIPEELNLDQTKILQLAEVKNGCLTKQDINSLLGWDNFRIDNCIEFMLKEGVIWVDGQSKPTSYYFPGLYLASI
jgi:ESCRT-II complex subunit VPS22